MSPAPEHVSAVIATRGDVDLAEPVRSLRDGGINDVVVWDNSKEAADFGPYGRFHAIELDRPKWPTILVQDDDVVLPPSTVRALCAAYQPAVLVANVPAAFRPHYPDSAILGFGAIFDAWLPERAFAEFFKHYGLMSRLDPLFLRESCRAFSVLTPRELVDLPKEDLPWAHADNRLWREPHHVSMREQMLRMARAVRDRR